MNIRDIRCEHDQPGGDQFCILCLRRIGDAHALRAAHLETALRNIVDDARDEGRADMRDSVDEQLIEQGRQALGHHSLPDS